MTRPDPSDGVASIGRVSRAHRSRTALVVLPLIALLLLAAACGSGGGSKAGTGTGGKCSYHRTTTAAAKKVDLPPGNPPTGNPQALTISTSAGDIRVILEPDQAPCAITNVAMLPPFHLPGAENTSSA